MMRDNKVTILNNILLNKVLQDHVESKLDAVNAILDLIEKNKCETKADVLDVINVYKSVLESYQYEADAKADHITSEQFPNV